MVLPPIDFTRIDLMDSTRNFSSRLLPACTNHFRGSNLTCCPYCGLYTIVRSDRYSELKIRIDVGLLTVIWYCCPDCHTHYYVPVMFTSQTAVYLQTQLIAMLKKFVKVTHGE